MKASNSGRLMQAAFPNCEIQTWQRKESERAIREWSADLQPLLLYPSAPESGSEPISPETLNGVEGRGFILLDATWQQAGKMLRQSPELQSMRRLALPVEACSQYQLRKHQQPGHLCTAEAGILLLQSLDFRGDAQQLEDYFQCFLRHYEAHRSNHSCTP